MEQRRILVVEDDGEIRQALEDILDFAGYAVRTATDGVAALDALDGWQPDAILLDMLMPEMDGPAFLAERQARGGPPIPTLILSAMRDLPERVSALPVVGYVAKPFDVGDLLSSVEAIWAGDG